WPTTWTAWAADSSWRPWSTVTPITRSVVSGPSLRASKIVAESSAIESGPPEQATRIAAPDGSRPPACSATSSAKVRRTATRPAATDGWRLIGRSRPQYARHPGVGVGDLGAGGEVLGTLPDDVEAAHPGLVDHGADERRAVAVLSHLGVEAEQAAN